jgi:hypothetical protein
VPDLVTPVTTAEGTLELPGDLEKADTKPPNVAAGPVFEASVLENASEGTKALVERLGLGNGSRLTFIVQQLQQEAAREARRAVKGSRPMQRVTQVGGAFWTESPDVPPQDAPGGPTTAADFGPGGPQFAGTWEREGCRVRPLGIADFRRVEQRLCCYEPGEVAHVENVLIGESKERNTRRLRTTEQTVTVLSEEERTEERDTQTTDRFEVQKETAKVIENELSFEAGARVAGSYGVIRFEVDARFAVSNSTQESDRRASNYAREVTERAVDRIVGRVREEKVTRIVEEFEDRSRHTLDNTGGTAHVVGLYRWLNKVYEAKIVNYGKRLMIEFMVPEPAAFHLHAMTKAAVENSLALERPIDPRSAAITAVLGLPQLRSHEDITEWGYGAYAGAYEAEVDPPPAPLITVGKAYHREGLDQTIQFADSRVDLKVPDGYEAQRFDAPLGLHSENQSGGLNWITIAIGRQSSFRQFGGTFSAVLHGEDDIVPVLTMGRTRMWGFTLEVVCSRTQTALAEWKIKTFNAIVSAYQTKLAEYQNALAEARAVAGIQIQGTNPARNRDIERTELRKWSVRLLADSCQPFWSDAMKDKGDCGYPEFDCCEAMLGGAYVQFVEQAFEWSLLTYLFYPYFWGRKCNWKQIYQMEDADGLFLAFLQAGFARVVVPVRPGYEDAVLQFLADGTIWDGGSVPVIGDPLFLALANEMKEPVGAVDPSVEPWRITVPTSLVALQCESGCVPGSGLPCPCDEAPTPTPTPPTDA